MLTFVNLEQLPYNPKSQNSEESSYFVEVFLLKQQQKHTSLFYKGNLHSYQRITLNRRI